MAKKPVGEPKEGTIVFELFEHRGNEVAEYFRGEGPKPIRVLYSDEAGMGRLLPPFLSYLRRHAEKATHVPLDPKPIPINLNGALEEITKEYVGGDMHCFVFERNYSIDHVNGIQKRLKRIKESNGLFPPEKTLSLSYIALEPEPFYNIISLDPAGAPV
jgi:hypothetical protein